MNKYNRRALKTQSRKENIDKYEIVLNILYHKLKYNKKLSMLKFCEEYRVSKNISTVLSNGGIIKNLKKGRSSSWEWISIPPTKEMAVKTLQELGRYNPQRKKATSTQISIKVKPKRGGKREGAGRPKTNIVIDEQSPKQVIYRSFFWGLYEYKETVK